MKYSTARAWIIVAGMACVWSAPVSSQTITNTDFGEILVNSNRQSAPFSQDGRPVIGLRRPADSIVMQVSFSSDTRDAAVRRQEIHAMLQNALDRAAAAGVDMVTGNFGLEPVTKANYKNLYLAVGPRVDTNVVSVMVKMKFAGSIETARQKMQAFVKSVPRSGRGAIDAAQNTSLTIINPDQYRTEIIKLVAEDARKQAAVFGPDYAVQVSGIDNQVFWSQISLSDVFLYIPYKFTIVPKK
jgi:hypothetical protein